MPHFILTLNRYLNQISVNGNQNDDTLHLEKEPFLKFSHMSLFYEKKSRKCNKKSVFVFLNKLQLLITYIIFKYTLFFISNTFISNVRPKLTNQSNKS